MTRIKHCIVTTSWDDGHPLDLKLAELLKKYNIKGTFYIPLSNPEMEGLNEKDIQILAKDFEIGAHTLTHVDLTTISLKEARKEINESKKLLEEITNEEVKMFCYPKGHYNRQIINLVKETGFMGARTVECFRLEMPRNPYRMWTTIHVHPSSIRKNLGNCMHNKNIRGLFSFLKNFGKSWKDLARYYFDCVYKHGGVFHLWGHSWEIEKFGLWDELEEIFEYISNKEKVNYVSNRELIIFMQNITFSNKEK